MKHRKNILLFLPMRVIRTLKYQPEVRIMKSEKLFNVMLMYFDKKCSRIYESNINCFIADCGFEIAE